MGMYKGKLYVCVGYVNYVNYVSIWDSLNLGMKGFYVYEII